MGKDFTNILKGKIVIVGIGNILKGDDGFGPALVQRLGGKIPAVCIDAGTTPENYTRKIIGQKPDIILLVDAVHLGKAPGDYELLNKTDILKTGFTTHDMSPRMFIEYLEQHTQAQIYLLGVQPGNIEFGREVSSSVAKTIENIAVKMEEVLHA